MSEPCTLFLKFIIKILWCQVHYLPWLYIRGCSLKNAIYICFKITHFRRKFWFPKSVLPGSFNFLFNNYPFVCSIHKGFSVLKLSFWLMIWFVYCLAPFKEYFCCCKILPIALDSVIGVSCIIYEDIWNIY